jgi:hypothetical protein
MNTEEIDKLFAETANQLAGNALMIACESSVTQDRTEISLDQTMPALPALPSSPRSTPNAPTGASKDPEETVSKLATSQEALIDESSPTRFGTYGQMPTTPLHFT